AKAIKLAELLMVEGFKASEGWLSNFKERHGIVFKKVQGEAAAVDMEAVDNWRQDILIKLLTEYSPKNVFNVDETGLFWRLMPDKTMTFKGDKCSGGKKSKERITVLVGSNMDGSEKIPLLVIGKSKKPRCFKNAKIPVEYEANKKSWMTSDIFEQWLKRWDRKLGIDKRKILLFVDNCSAHPKIQLKNIKLQFFLPNATAEVQNLEEDVLEPELPQLDDLWARIQEEGGIDEQTELADFIDVDQVLATTGTRTLEEIAASTSSTAQAEPESEEDEPELQPIP
ncbi:hypothetical protein ZOSMA_10068G00010, partial [Zostera marina]